MKKPLNEILPTIGAPASSIENWLMPDRLRLYTSFEGTTRGRARLFSRNNTLELALIAAFIKAGAAASGAAAMAEAVLRAETNAAALGRPKNYDVREWWVFAAGDMTKGSELSTINLKKLQPRLKPAWPPVLTIVHVGEIVRRVDKLFGGE